MSIDTPISGLCESLSRRPDAEKLFLGWAVPHRSHLPGMLKEGNRCRERAWVVDAGSFIYVSCHCGATPYEIAEDLGLGPVSLQPHAAEQSTMLKVQRRLRENLQDPDALSFLSLRGLTVTQALLWKLSDAGLPPEHWSGADRKAGWAPCDLCGAAWAAVPPPLMVGELRGRNHASGCPRKPSERAVRFGHGGADAA